MSQVLLGPVFGFRGCKSEAWGVTALFVLDTPGDRPELKVQRLFDNKVVSVEPVVLLQRPDAVVLRYSIPAERAVGSDTTYQISLYDRTGAFTVPQRGVMPRMAYVSCNGFSDAKTMKKVADKNERWRHLLARHNNEDSDGRRSPFHLLLMGGDQVYADSLWSDLGWAREWAELDRDDQAKYKCSAEQEKEIVDFYFRLYVTRWAQRETSSAFASIPTVMMWDDHDIFDGWGSHHERLQACDVFQKIFRHATRYFRIFQQHSLPDAPQDFALSGQGGHSFAHDFGDVALIALDMRSERTNSQVMTTTAWNAVDTWLKERPESPRHLFVMSSIPVVHPDFGLVEAIMRVIPGTQELEDDLRDHWRSRPHREERLRLIHRLFGYAKLRKCRITLLSGDVHVAAVGVISNERGGVNGNEAVINQLTSSGIVHPAPPGIVLHFLEGLGDNEEKVDRGITASMLEFPTTRRRFIGARNWMSLEPDTVDPQYRYWINWHVEGESHPYTKAIHPVTDAA